MGSSPGSRHSAPLRVSRRIRRASAGRASSIGSRELRYRGYARNQSSPNRARGYGEATLEFIAAATSATEPRSWRSNTVVLRLRVETDGKRFERRARRSPSARHHLAHPCKDEAIPGAGSATFAPHLTRYRMASWSGNVGWLRSPPGPVGLPAGAYDQQHRALVAVRVRSRPPRQVGGGPMTPDRCGAAACGPEAERAGAGLHHRRHKAVVSALRGIIVPGAEASWCWVSVVPSCPVLSCRSPDGPHRSRAPDPSDRRAGNGR